MTTSDDGLVTVPVFAGIFASIIEVTREALSLAKAVHRVKHFRWRRQFTR